jgi:TldD protein
MKDLALLAIDTAKSRGASYADVRIIETAREAISVRNGALGEISQEDDAGFGVRVLKNGAWGFACAPRVSKAEIERVAARAVEVAEASAIVKRSDVRLAEEPAWQDTWCTPYVLNPFRVSQEEKLALLFKIDEILRRRPEIKVSIARLGFLREKQWFASTDGSLIYQDLLRSGGGFAATAVGNGDSQTRSFPMSFEGQFKSGGYEIVLGLRLLENAERTRDEAIALLSAEPCPRKTTDLILGNGQLCLQIHESVGHANELDRVLGWEANYAGRSFNTIDHLGKFRYGSEIVNLVADTTVPGGLATFGYDDDGVKAQRFHVVKDGIFTGYFETRDTAPFVGHERSNGCNRAEGWRNIPITRIPNLSLMPGTWKLEDLIADTKDGIFMDTNRSWSIDQLRLNFQFGCEVAWEIKDGKLGKMLKNPTYQGITPQFWRSCDAICDHDHWDLIGVINCGKGQPGQTAEMSHGSAPARFRGVEVGIRAGK